MKNIMILQSSDLTLFSPILTIISTIVSIIVAVIIAKDAKSRDMNSVGFVILTCICGWCIGGIVYLIAKSNHPQVYSDNRFNNEPQYSYQQSTSGYDQSRDFNQQSSSQYGQRANIQSQNEQQNNTNRRNFIPKSNLESSENESVSENTCPACGSINRKNSKFCSFCGRKFF